MVYFISRQIYKAILKLFFKFKATGRENVPNKGPFIMVSNHMSYSDPVVMGVACHTVPLAFIAKRELFDAPFFGLWVKAVGCISIERFSGSSAPLKKALKKLKEGGAIGIFPEGTRSRDGSLQSAQPGIGIIAAKSKATLIPMHISGTDKALPVGRRFPRLCPIKANIGPAIDISGADAFSDKREFYEFIGKKVMEAIAELR